MSSHTYVILQNRNDLLTHWKLNWFRTHAMCLKRTFGWQELTPTWDVTLSACAYPLSYRFEIQMKQPSSIWVGIYMYMYHIPKCSFYSAYKRNGNNDLLRVCSSNKLSWVTQYYFKNCRIYVYDDYFHSHLWKVHITRTVLI